MTNAIENTQANDAPEMEQIGPQWLKEQLEHGPIKAVEDRGETMVIVTVTAYAKGWATVTHGEDEYKVRLNVLFMHEESEHGRNMSNTLAKYRVGYVPSVANSGKKSLHCGDAVADALEYKALEDLYLIAGEILEGWTAETLKAKYERLNIGAQRMNVGNRIRAAYKRGDAAVVQWVEDNLGGK